MFYENKLDRVDKHIQGLEREAKYLLKAVRKYEKCMNLIAKDKLLCEKYEKMIHQDYEEQKRRKIGVWRGR